MCLYALKSLSIFQVAPQILVPYVKVGSAKALNRWDLCSRHGTPTKVAIKACIRAIHRPCLMAQSTHMHRK